MPLVSTTSATPSPGRMAANCTGVPRTKCTERPRGPVGARRDSSKPPSSLHTAAQEGMHVNVESTACSTLRRSHRRRLSLRAVAGQAQRDLSHRLWNMSSQAASRPDRTGQAQSSNAWPSAASLLRAIQPSHLVRCSTGSCAPPTARALLRKPGSVSISEQTAEKPLRQWI